MLKTHNLKCLDNTSKYDIAVAQPEFDFKNLGGGGGGIESLLANQIIAAY